MLSPAGCATSEEGLAANDDQLLLAISHLDLSGASGATATESVPGVDIATAA